MQPRTCVVVFYSGSCAGSPYNQLLVAFESGCRKVHIGKKDDPEQRRAVQAGGIPRASPTSRQDAKTRETRLRARGIPATSHSQAPVSSPSHIPQTVPFIPLEHLIRHYIDQLELLSSSWWCNENESTLRPKTERNQGSMHWQALQKPTPRVTARRSRRRHTKETLVLSQSHARALFPRPNENAR